MQIKITKLPAIYLWTRSYTERILASEPPRRLGVSGVSTAIIAIAHNNKHTESEKSFSEKKKIK